jgi:NADH:ubiquinone oxidoreductase subunit
MDPAGPRAYIGTMNFGTWLFTLVFGRLVGQDSFGNRYYEEKRPRRGMRGRRWVAYAGTVEASMVPPEWHAWLHYTTETPLSDAPRRPWQLPHIPNLTGTPGSYRPPGHDYRGGNRGPTTGDYEAWRPGNQESR